MLYNKGLPWYDRNPPATTVPARIKNTHVLERSLRGYGCAKHVPSAMRRRTPRAFRHTNALVDTTNLISMLVDQIHRREKGHKNTGSASAATMETLFSRIQEN